MAQTYEKDCSDRASLFNNVFTISNLVVAISVLVIGLITDRNVGYDL